MARDTELDDILNPDIFLDEEGQPIRNKGQLEETEKLAQDLQKLGVGTTALSLDAFLALPSVPVELFNAVAAINDAPGAPSPQLISNFIRAAADNEYNYAPLYYKTAEYLGAFAAGETAYIAALNKIQKSSPKTYAALTRMFPYSVGQLHTGITIGVDDAKKQAAKQKKKATKTQKLIGGFKGFIKNIKPTGPVLAKLFNNYSKITKAGLIYGLSAPLLKEAFVAGALGDGTITGQQDQIIKEIFNPSQINRIDDGIGGTTYELVYEDGTAPQIINNDIMEAFFETDQMKRIIAKERRILDEKKFKEDFDKAPLFALRRYYDEDTGGQTRQSKISMIMDQLGSKLKEAPALDNVLDFIDTGEDRSKDDEIIDLYSTTTEGIQDNAKDKALNEQYVNERLNVGQAPFVTDPNPKLAGMSIGGEITDTLLEQANVFEDSPMEEVQMASLFGRVPLWAIQNIDKAKMLTQKLTNAEKKQLEALEKKVGTVEEVNLSSESLDDTVDVVADDVGTALTQPKSKKTIIDSPEGQESVFYSNLEARLMDPNTPPVFNSPDQFYSFMQQKGISKPEIEDNILSSYIEQAKKSGLPLSKQAMLSIVRQAPQRKIETTTYGFGGDKPAKYPGYQEPGAIDGTYREQVLYLNPSAIPGDPDQLPGSVHDFTERYVIGWSRLTDRNGTIPGAEGLFTAADKKMLATLRKNQTKLYNQLVGLETSALRKLDREGLVNVDLNIDDLTAQEISTIIDARVSDLERIDPALLQQIRQFKSKLQDDLVKVKNLEQAQAGSKVIVTFADEIQSDILQQAKKLELDLKEQIGDLMDLPMDARMRELARQRLSYEGKARQVEPQVLKYYTRNETIFRPMFTTAEEMQTFIDEFRVNKKIFEDLAKQGPSPEPQLIAAAQKAAKKEREMLERLDVGLSDAALKQLFPNVPFKNRMEWGSALIKRDIALAAKRLFVDKAEGAAQWYAVTPAKFVKNRYSQTGGTNTPINERTSDMKGIGTEEFYGGPDSTDFKGKHYTSTVEKILKRAAKENNSEFKIIEVDGVGEVFAIKITPEMLLPHKTHRKRGGLVYTPESIIDIFEAA